MKLLRRNLAYLIEKRGINPTQLAKATGVPQPTIQRILSGESDDPRTNTLTPLADHFGVTVEYLRTGDIEGGDIVAKMAMDEGPPPEFEYAPTVGRFKRVPIVGTVQGGPDGYLEEAGYPVGHGDGVVEYPARDPNAYALRVRGDSMRPRIKSGEFIIVEPNTPAKPGDDVVVICSDGRKMVKEFLYQRDGELCFGSISNGFPPVTLLSSDIDAIHIVAAIVPRGAFYKST